MESGKNMMRFLKFYMISFLIFKFWSLVFGLYQEG